MNKQRARLAVSMSGVIRRYPGFTLGPIDLQIPGGTTTALIGPNGAGKTTLIEVLAGVASPAAGSVALLNGSFDPLTPAAKQRVGFAGEHQPFYETWTVGRNLNYLRRFYPTWSVERETQLTERLKLPTNKQVRALSKGNRVKVGLVAALAQNPLLLLLDEPTGGLDPLVRAELLDVLFTEMARGEMTIIYSTHTLSEVERLADELVFVRDGQLLLTTPAHVIQEKWGRVSFSLEPSALPQAIKEGFLEHAVKGNDHLATTADLEVVTDRLRALGATRLETKRLSLEEAAIHILRADASQIGKLRHPDAPLEQAPLAAGGRP